MKQHTGFTLIELMVTVTIIAIIAAIAYPSYQEYIRRQRLAVAQQEMQIIAGELERFKAKNFNYKNFDMSYLHSAFNAATGTLEIPVDKPNKTYTITLVDAENKKPLTDSTSTGLNWIMIAERTPADARNYDLLIDNRTNTRCKTKTENVVSGFTDCGTDSESW